MSPVCCCGCENKKIMSETASKTQTRMNPDSTPGGHLRTRFKIEQGTFNFLVGSKGRFHPRE